MKSSQGYFRLGRLCRSHNHENVNLEISDLQQFGTFFMQPSKNISRILWAFQLMNKFLFCAQHSL